MAARLTSREIDATKRGNVRETEEYEAYGIKIIVPKDASADFLEEAKDACRRKVEKMLTVCMAYRCSKCNLRDWWVIDRYPMSEKINCPCRHCHTLSLAELEVPYVFKDYFDKEISEEEFATAIIPKQFSRADPDWISDRPFFLDAIQKEILANVRSQRTESETDVWSAKKHYGVPRNMWGIADYLATRNFSPMQNQRKKNDNRMLHHPGQNMVEGNS